MIRIERVVKSVAQWVNNTPIVEDRRAGASEESFSKMPIRLSHFGDQDHLVCSTTVPPGPSWGQFNEWKTHSGVTGFHLHSKITLEIFLGKERCANSPKNFRFFWCFQCFGFKYLGIFGILYFFSKYFSMQNIYSWMRFFPIETKGYFMAL